MQNVADFIIPTDTVLLLINLSRALFVIANIWLNYSFLSPRKYPVWLQIAVISTAWILIYLLRDFLEPIVQNHFWVGYVLSLLYLIPFTLIFQETFHAKLFVFLLVFTINQCIFQILYRFEILLFNNIIGTLLFMGFLLEVMLIPAINKHLRCHIRNILDVLGQQNQLFIILPILSFCLLAFISSGEEHSLITFISLVLLVFYIGFSYYLIALSIVQTKRNQQLELTARTDSLTGLYNRRHMEYMIQSEYAKYQKSGLEFALIAIDLDNFKLINDTHGHTGGDFLLKSVSEDIINTVRERHAVARWGGDEFLLLLPETNLQETLETAERINKTIRERPYTYGSTMLSLTLTIGAYIVRSGDTVDKIIENADKGMYRGKWAGRDCVILYND